MGNAIRCDVGFPAACDAWKRRLLCGRERLHPCDGGALGSVFVEGGLGEGSAEGTVEVALRQLVPGVVEDLFGIALLDDLTQIHEDDMVGDASGLT